MRCQYYHSFASFVLNLSMLSPYSEYVVAKVWKHSDCWYAAFVEYVTVTF